MLHYSTDINDVMHIRLIEIRGKVLYNEKVIAKTEGEILMPSNVLPDGLYFVDIQCGGQHITHKLIKHR